MTDERSDLEGLRALEPQAITAIHNRYFPKLYRYAAYRISDHLEAEDVASKTLMLLLETVASGKGPRSSLRGWLMGTASNLINDYFRRVYRHPTESLKENIISDEPDPANNVEKTDRRREVRAALRQLTQEQQHVLSLRFGAGYSLNKTAGIMNKRPNAIKALQFRALAALRRQLGEDVP